MAVARLEKLGMMALEGDRLRVTEAGALLLDAILPEIVVTPGSTRGLAAVAG